MSGCRRSSILLLNAGSSSLKFAISADSGRRVLLSGQVASIGADATFDTGGTKKTLPPGIDHRAALDVVFEAIADELGTIGGIGHRIVHGGAQYTAPVIIDAAVLGDLDGLRRLAPLHMPPCLDVLNRIRALAPGVPNIACFDTAFHATQPDVATRLPIPRAYRDRGYRRYGFHGLSYEHLVEALPRITGAPLPRRIVAAHLGYGSSLCAILDGKSVATTMGYSTADGLVMGTRTGSIDPGVLLGLMRNEGLDAGAIETLLYRESGLLALSGVSGDMKTLLDSGTPAARSAVEHYCYSAARHAASLLVALGGLDALVFTGGIGENAKPVRDRIAALLSWITPAIAVHVIPADEERVMARHVSRLLAH
ncbi:acetate kinase [soil metagenome]